MTHEEVCRGHHHCMSPYGQGDIFLLLQELPANMIGTPLPTQHGPRQILAPEWKQLLLIAIRAPSSAWSSRAALTGRWPYHFETVAQWLLHFLKSLANYTPNALPTADSVAIQNQTPPIARGLVGHLPCRLFQGFICHAVSSSAAISAAATEGYGASLC